MTIKERYLIRGIMGGFMEGVQIIGAIVIILLAMFFFAFFLYVIGSWIFSMVNK